MSSNNRYIETLNKLHIKGIISKAELEQKKIEKAIKEVVDKGQIKQTQNRIRNK